VIGSEGVLTGGPPATGPKPPTPRHRVGASQLARAGGRASTNGHEERVGTPAGRRSRLAGWAEREAFLT
jgi:hypothetical protein